MAKVTTKQAAKILDCTERHVLWYNKAGYLHGEKVADKVWLFEEEEVRALVKPKKGRPPKKRKGKK